MNPSPNSDEIFCDELVDNLNLANIDESNITSFIADDFLNTDNNDTTALNTSLFDDESTFLPFEKTFQVNDFAVDDDESNANPILNFDDSSFKKFESEIDNEDYSALESLLKELSTSNIHTLNLFAPTTPSESVISTNDILEKVFKHGFERGKQDVTKNHKNKNLEEYYAAITTTSIPNRYSTSSALAYYIFARLTGFAYNFLIKRDHQEHFKITQYLYPWERINNDVSSKLKEQLNTYCQFNSGETKTSGHEAQYIVDRLDALNEQSFKKNSESFSPILPQHYFHLFDLEHLNMGFIEEYKFYIDLYLQGTNPYLQKISENFFDQIHKIKLDNTEHNINSQNTLENQYINLTQTPSTSIANDNLQSQVHIIATENAIFHEDILENTFIFDNAAFEGINFEDINIGTEIFNNDLCQNANNEASDFKESLYKETDSSTPIIAESNKRRASFSDLNQHAPTPKTSKKTDNNELNNPAPTINIDPYEIIKAQEIFNAGFKTGSSEKKEVYQKNLQEYYDSRIESKRKKKYPSKSDLAYYLFAQVAGFTYKFLISRDYQEHFKITQYLYPWKHRQDEVSIEINEKLTIYRQFNFSVGSTLSEKAFFIVQKLGELNQKCYEANSSAFSPILPQNYFHLFDAEHLDQYFMKYYDTYVNNTYTKMPFCQKKSANYINQFLIQPQSTLSLNSQNKHNSFNLTFFNSSTISNTATTLSSNGAEEEQQNIIFTP
ncbi:MAG: hypothetical protein Tsb005_12390 [Gammaproteobacteria bacterium]